jgi:cytochrome P450
VISIIDIIVAAFNGKSVSYRFKEIMSPKLRKKGYAILYRPFKWRVIISKPEIAKDLFRNTDQFLKPVNPNPGSLNKLFFGGINIVGSNGEEYKRFRRPINPIIGQSFQPELFSSCVLETLDALGERVDRLQGQPVEVNDLMELMALDSLGKGIFSHDFEAVKSLGSSNYYRLYSEIMNFFFNPIFSIIPPLTKLPFGPPEKARKKIIEFNSLTLNLINQRRRDLESGKFNGSRDLLSCMLRKDPDSPYEPLTDEELVQNINLFFFAGHDTTASTLSYALYNLARNRDVQDKLRSDIYQKMGLNSDHKKLALPTSEQVKNMECLHLVIKETMRSQPPILHLGRTLGKDYSIAEDNLVIPKGTNIALSIYDILHDPKIYPNPEKFDPERFLNAKYDVDTYMPFGGGARMCIGVNFSLMEQKVFFALLLQKFDLRIAKDNPDYEELRVSGFGLTRPTDLKISFEARF